MDDAATGDPFGRSVAAEPEPPHLGPCPPGWRSIDRAPLATVCDPYPASGFTVCPVGEAHFPGTDGCERLGPPCPAGPFADPETVHHYAELGASGAVYVAPGSTSGDGTREHPFGSVEEAAVGRPYVIVLAKGTYPPVIADEPLRLIGACPEETRIASFRQERGADDLSTEL